MECLQCNCRANRKEKVKVITAEHLTFTKDALTVMPEYLTEQSTNGQMSCQEEHKPKGYLTDDDIINNVLENSAENQDDLDTESYDGKLTLEYFWVINISIFYRKRDFFQNEKL